MRELGIAVIISLVCWGVPALQRSPRWSYFYALEDLCSEKCQATGKPLGRLLGFTCSCYCPVLNPPADNDPCDDTVGPSCQRFCQKLGYSGGACPYNGICMCFCTLFDRYSVPPNASVVEVAEESESAAVLAEETAEPQTTIDIGQFDSVAETTPSGTAEISKIEDAELATSTSNPETTTDIPTTEDASLATSTETGTSTTDSPETTTEMPPTTNSVLELLTSTETGSSTTDNPETTTEMSTTEDASLATSENSTQTTLAVEFFNSTHSEGTAETYSVASQNDTALVCCSSSSGNCSVPSAAFGNTTVAECSPAKLSNNSFPICSGIAAGNIITSDCSDVLNSTNSEAGVTANSLVAPPSVASSNDNETMPLCCLAGSGNCSVPVDPSGLSGNITVSDCSLFVASTNTASRNTSVLAAYDTASDISSTMPVSNHTVPISENYEFPNSTIPEHPIAAANETGPTLTPTTSEQIRIFNYTSNSSTTEFNMENFTKSRISAEIAAAGGNSINNAVKLNMTMDNNVVNSTKNSITRSQFHESGSLSSNYTKIENAVETKPRNTSILPKNERLSNPFPNNNVSKLYLDLGNVTKPNPTSKTNVTTAMNNITLSKVPYVPVSRNATGTGVVVKNNTVPKSHTIKPKTSVSSTSSDAWSWPWSSSSTALKHASNIIPKQVTKVQKYASGALKRIVEFMID